MINSLVFPLLILAAQAESPIASRRGEADEIYRCDFEEEFDKNYDNWPDDWTRQKGRGYPFYLPVEIETDTSRSGSSRVLKMQLDGGGALIHSPRIPIRPAYSYVLQVNLKTAQLKHDLAFCTVTFLDAKFNKMETYSSDKLRPDTWTVLEIGPITPKSPMARWATISFHLTPTEKADLVGAAWFDDLWFGSLPRMAITADANGPYNVFTDPKNVAITCRVSGFSANDPVLTFELIDVDGEIVHTEEREIRNLNQDFEAGRPPGAKAATAEPVDPSGFAGAANWRPPIPQKGFYRIRAFVPGNTNTVIERSLSLAVVDPQPVTKNGEFGWSIPQGDNQSGNTRQSGRSWRQGDCAASAGPHPSSSRKAAKCQREGASARSQKPKGGAC